MTWELYEVWAEDDFGHEELIETTNSRKEALSIAEKTINEGMYFSVYITRETQDGSYDEIERLTA